MLQYPLFIKQMVHLSVVGAMFEFGDERSCIYVGQKHPPEVGRSRLKSAQRSVVIFSPHWLGERSCTSKHLTSITIINDRSQHPSNYIKHRSPLSNLEPMELEWNRLDPWNKHSLSGSLLGSTHVAKLHVYWQPDGYCPADDMRDLRWWDVNCYLESVRAQGAYTPGDSR